MQKIYRLKYDKPAPNRSRASDKPDAKDPDWEEWSLPLGCGHFGVNIFGRPDVERMQVTEVSLTRPYPYGVNNFAEVYLDFGHSEDEVTDYCRDLVLNDATAHVRYDYGGVSYEREYFTSYPDGVLAVKLTASRKGGVFFALTAKIPYLRPPGEDQTAHDTAHYKGGIFMGKSGAVAADGNRITLSGELEHYGVLYEGQILVINEGGTVSAKEGRLRVDTADSVVILMAVGTNYVLTENVYLEEDRTKKLAGNAHPHKRITETIEKAAALGYEELRRRHTADYGAFFSRVHLDLGGAEGKPTDSLLTDYKAGKPSPYLEELYFQYGRYLLISSSRKGTLPGNLQGLWNQYDRSPWSAGYWHNINIQMNYWPTFTTNLAEMFESYADMNKAFRKLAQRYADEYLAQIRRDKSAENPDAEYTVPVEENGTGKNGWAVGTGGWPYALDKPAPNSHSGPGTGGLTAKLFWDYYDYTRDREILSETVYPVLSGMVDFLCKTVIEKDGLYLAHPSSSPEQRVGNNYYQTTGCAFDQQMIYENHRDCIAAAKILGIDDKTVRTAKEQLDKLDPVIVGESGQIKEYREEKKYGEIGDPLHRHISQLVALSPGQAINQDTPKWLAAAKITLVARGDRSTGWAMAHRLNAWARMKDGEHAYLVFQTLLRNGTLNNLWDTHPPFQIDGNYGGTAGVAEMLLQSNSRESESVIEPLPALPGEWAAGRFDGLVARGNFVVGCEWENGKLRTMTITARRGGTCRIRYPGISGAAVTCNDNAAVTKDSDDLVLNTTENGEYTIRI